MQRLFFFILPPLVGVYSRLNNNLQQQIALLIQKWFVNFDPFSDSEYIDTEIGAIPANWSVINLSNIADFFGGYAYKSDELMESTCAMATIKNFDRNGGFKLDGFKEIVPSNKLKPQHRVSLFDILVAHTDLTQNAEVIGNAEVLLSSGGYESVIMSMDLVKVIPKAGVSKYLLAALLSSKQFKGHCLGYVNGTTVLHLNKKALPEYRLPYPNNSTILQPLIETLESFYLLLANNIEENISLSQTRDSLLSRLMTGRLDASKIVV